MGVSTNITPIASQGNQTLTSNIDKKAKKSSKSAKYSIISPDNKSKLGQYFLLGITFCFLSIITGGNALSALMSATPLFGVSLIDYHWETLTNASKLKLKDDKRGWMPQINDILAVIVPILYYIL